MGRLEIKVGGRKFLLRVMHGDSVRLVGELSNLEYIKLIQQVVVELRNAKERKEVSFSELEWEKEEKLVVVAVQGRYFYTPQQREDQAILLRHYVALALQFVLHAKN